jgi:hypothetical protein
MAQKRESEVDPHAAGLAAAEAKRRPSAKDEVLIEDDSFDFGDVGIDKKSKGSHRASSVVS